MRQTLIAQTPWARVCLSDVGVALSRRLFQRVAARINVELTAYHFNQFSAVGVIANSIVVPIMAVGGVILGLTACAIGLIAPALGAPLLIAAGWSLAVGTWLAGWFARWPGAWFRIFTPSLLEIAIIYGLLLLWLTRPIEPAAIIVPPRPTARVALRWRRACCVVLAVLLAGHAGSWRVISGARKSCASITWS